MVKSRQLFLFKVIVVIYYLAGLLGLSFGQTRELFSGLVPCSLLLSAGILLYFHPSWSRRTVFVFVLLWLSGYLLQMAGLWTGKVFGDFLYGPALGPALYGTPLVIGLNWFILTYCAYYIFKGNRSIWLQALLAAMLMVMFDFVLEPVAMQMYWWLWVYGAIPLQNFLAWFVISYLMILLMHQSKPSERNPIAQFLFIVQFLFYLALNITL